MFRSSDEVLDARAAIVQQFRNNEITPEIAIERIRAIEPGSPFGFALEGDLLAAAGDLAGAEEALWNGLAGAPCSVGPLFHLAGIREKRGGDTGAVLPFRLLGLWQIASCDVVPDEVARNFEELGKAARAPEAYNALAERTQAALGDAPWPERLEPYRLLTAVQRESISGLDPDLLREILDRYDCCEPVFRAALRQWADDEAAPLSDESASLLLAILGERGGPGLIDDLMPDDQYPTSPVMWHAEWAVWRLGQRFPAEAFDRLQALAATADTTARGLLAEQFYLLPSKAAGRKEAILRLLDGFPQEDDPEESAYLLLTVSTLMEMLGSPADARAVMEKHQRRLDAETRRNLNEMLGGEHPFVPNLVSLALDELGIEEIAIDLALMDDPEGGHDHDHDDFDDIDDEFEDEYDEPEIAEPRPGRNDPCWCGSGKKYKKCHLAEDEEGDRAASSPGAAEFSKVLNDILETTLTKMNRADAVDANRLFFNCEPGMLEPGDDDQGAFLQWMVLDFRASSTGRTATEEYLRRRGGRLPGREKALVDGFGAARYALWEVLRVEKGRGIEIKDYFGGGEPFFVADISCSKQFAEGQFLIAYAFQRDGKWEFFAEGLAVPRPVVEKVAEMVESGSRETNLAPSEYFRSRSHEWRRIIAQAAGGR